MMNEHYTECRTLPAINETFPQFSRPISLLSPLDLSLRASNVIPITPPSTPSPPRKRQRLMSDENYLWRPHVMETVVATLPTATATGTTAETTTATTETTGASAKTEGNYFQHLTYACDGELRHPQHEGTALQGYQNNLYDVANSFEEIPESQASAPQQSDLATIYVDDETIVLTEDEEDETLVSSHDFNEEADDEEDEEIYEAALMRETERLNGALQERRGAEEEEEEEYVDILSNDDDDLNPLSAQQQQSQAAAEAELESAGRVLTRNKLVYDNEELHHKAIDGLAKLFERDFRPRSGSGGGQEAGTTFAAKKTYTDLSNTGKQVEVCHAREGGVNQRQTFEPPASVARPSYSKTHKSERKRMKLRKHMCLDEETISPVSGTIIRKLRDDEELVVRKGDIDPAFNVVEITEEAKAILASIDNKIGAYLCQLCRTLYDDAFMLAQHRCPRIVHIEYKCSECEKVFNCPANLASHRRWHKPKSELMANSQNKKRHASEQTNQLSSTHEKSRDDEDGIFPCPQCGKNFRRHAYLKKHQASHQMLDNLKSLDIFKNATPTKPNFPHPLHQQPGNTAMFSATSAPLQHAPSTHASSSTYPLNANHAHSLKPYPRFPNFGFPPFDQRRFYSLGELYLSQHLDRSSAFQYVQANHLRNLQVAASNFVPRPLVAPLLTIPPVK